MFQSKCVFYTIVATFISASATLLASGGIDDDFSTYPAGTQFENNPFANEKGWAWTALPLAKNEGSVEVIAADGDPQILKVDLPFLAAGVGHWRLLAELDQPLEHVDDHHIKLQIVLRIPDLSFPMDFVVGIVAPARSKPLSLGAEDLQTIFRFLMSPDTGRALFSYVSWADGGNADTVNYRPVPSFEVREGEWYRISVVFKPQQQTYDLEVQTEDGSAVFEALDVEWARQLPGTSGVAFKNRTTNDLRGARFDLRHVALEATVPGSE